MHRNFALTLAFALVFAGGNAAFAENDAFKDLPADHVVGVGPDGVATIELDTLGMSGFNDATVAAFDAQGRAVDAFLRGSRLDIRGAVGPVGVLVNGPQFHGATLYYLEPSTQAAAVEELPPNELVLGENKQSLVGQAETVVSTSRAFPGMPHMMMTMVSPESLMMPLAGVSRDQSVSIRPLDGFSLGQKTDGRVQLSNDGTMKGRILATSSASVSGDTIYLLSEGVIIDTTKAAADGSYSFMGVRPGVYGLITAGASGYTAQGFEAVGTGASFTSNPSSTDGQTLVAQPAGAPSVLPSVPIPSPITDPAVDEIERNYPEVGGPIEGALAGDPIVDFGAPVASPFGGFGGGGAGGGGGFGGFGGFGGLGALGAAAALAGTDDDNDAVSAPVVASPVIPN